MNTFKNINSFGKGMAGEVQIKEGMQEFNRCNKGLTNMTMKIYEQRYAIFFKYQPTAASLTDCFTTKQSLAGLEFRLSAECSPGDILVLK
jgi:hypothetical protein